jgi:hypothetical protein
VDQASRELIRRYAAGDGNVDEKPLMLAIPASPGWRGVMQALGAPERLAAALRGGWKAVADVSFRLAEDAGSVGVMQGVSENEMVVMLALRIEGEPAAQLRIVYPYIALEPFVPFME